MNEHDLPPEVRQGYRDFLQEAMQPRLAEVEIPPHIQKRLDEAKSDDIKSRGVVSIVSSAGLGFLSGGWAGAALGAVGAFLNRPPKQPQQEEKVQGNTGFADTGQAIGRPGDLIPIVHTNAVINPNGGRRLAGIPIFAEIRTIGGRQERRIKYLVSLGRIGAIDEDEILIDEQPRSNYQGNELLFEWRNGTENQTPIDGMAYYSQVVQPRQFNEISLDQRSAVSGVDEISETGAGMVNVANPSRGELCVDGGLPAGVFGEQAVDPANGGYLCFRAPSNDGAIGLSSNEVDLQWVSIEFGLLFDTAAGTYEVVENGNVMAGPFPYSSNDLFCVEVSQAIAANFPNPAEPSQVTYTQNGVNQYTSAISPNAPLFLDLAMLDAATCFASVEVNGVQFNATAQSEYSLRIEDEREFERFNELDIYHVCPDIYFKVVRKDPVQQRVIIENAPYYALDGNGFTGSLVEIVGEPIYEYDYIRFENTKRVGGRGNPIAENGRCCRFNMRYNLHAFTELNERLTHGIVYDVFVRRVDQPNMSHLIRLYSDDNLRRETFAMFDTQNMPLGRYYWEIRPVICDCTEEPPPELPTTDIGDRTCITGSRIPLSSPISVRFDIPNLSFGGVPSPPTSYGLIIDPNGSPFWDERDFAELTDIYPPANTNEDEYFEVDCGVTIGPRQCVLIGDEELSVHLVQVDGDFFTWLVLRPTGNLVGPQYTIEVEPALSDISSDCPDPATNCIDTYPIYHLDDNGYVETIVTNYDAGDGPVEVVGEIDPEPLDPAWVLERISFTEEKRDISSQNNWVARLDFVSEQVTPEKLTGAPNAGPDQISYPGLAYVAATFRDPDTNSNVSFLINEGIESFNHLEAGLIPEDALNAQPSTFTDPAAEFITAGVTNGMIFEDLLSGAQTQIAAVISETELQFEQAITLTPCGFYRVGFIGALVYFPDVFAWYIMNQDVGVGSYFPMPQFFIDWGSIAVARRWVEAQRYFYDRVISERIPFQQWAEDEARNSRLLLVRLGGQFKLRIDEPPPIPAGLAFEFNASNTRDFQLEGIRQQERRINTTIVTFPDGRVDTTVGSYVIPPSFSHDGHRRDRPQSVTIETDERANRLEPTSEQTYVAESVTNEYQAVDVASLFMKRKRMRLQAKFVTGWAGINLQAGDWVSAHEKQYNGAETFAGYVSEIIEPYSDGCQTVAISDCFVKFRDCVSTTAPGVFTLNGGPDIVEFLRVGELIKLSDDSTVAIAAIDAASGQITFTPALELTNEPVTFLKTDFSNDEALVYHYNLNEPGQEGITEEATGLEAIVSNETIHLKLCTAEPLEVLDVITVGPTVMTDTIYRVTNTAPRDGNELEVTCVEDTPDNNSKAGLVFKYDDAAIAVQGV